MSTDQDVAIAWDKSAKGRGNRWRMMRDVVACLAMRSMNLMQVQNSLMRLRGLSRSKVHEMMMELQQAGDIREVSGTIGGTTINGWAATDQGVHFWLNNTRKGIPATIVKVLPIMLPVSTSEENKIHQRGPSA